MFSIILIVFIAVVAAQVVLALLSKLRGVGLHKKFNNALSSQVTLAELLEKYSRLEHNLNVTVNAAVTFPAQAVQGVVLVNRNWVYKPNLFPTFYGLWQLVLTSNEFSNLKRLHRLQIIIYLGQFIFLALGFLVLEIIVLVALILGLLSIVFSLYVENFYEQSLQKAYKLATDYLQLDRLEQTRALVLLDHLRGLGFAYSLQPFIFILRFIGLRI